MRLSNFYQVLFPALVWFSATLHLTLAITSEAHSQYIWYDGILTGEFQLPDSAPSNCSGFNLTRMTNASMSVGVNPPWDKNPFYWELRNAGTVVSGSGSGSCFSLGGCTRDSVFNLYFATADYQCFKNGTKCAFIVFSPFYYQALQMVDLTTATVSSYTNEGMNGYTVTGNPGNYVSNGTVNYYFDFQAPDNYSTKCLTWSVRDQIRFYWNSTTTFTYTLNFTNTTVSSEIKLGAPAGTVVMRFSGARKDDSATAKNGHDPYNALNYTPIALDTSNPSKPQFTFVNGSKIQFNSRGYNEYTASAGSGSSNDGGRFAVAGWWVGWAVVLGVVLGF